MARKLRFNILTSKTFSVGAPLIIHEIKKRNYVATVITDERIPDYETLLDCDVFFDMSSITDIAHYLEFKSAYDVKVSRNLKVPLLIDPPMAVINAMDKSRTNELFSDLIPKTFNLDGINNVELINKFKDEFVIVKKPVGWGGRGVEKLDVKKAQVLLKNRKGIILQEYLEPINGVGRILTLNHQKDFQLLCVYKRVSKSWKVGSQAKYSCKLESADSKLIEFARLISEKSNLYLNGIDYIKTIDGKLYLLEINAVPAIKEPMVEFGINTPKLIIDHIERNVTP